MAQSAMFLITNSPGIYRTHRTDYHTERKRPESECKYHAWTLMRQMGKNIYKY